MESTPVAPTVEELKANIGQEVTLLMEWILTCQSLTFFAVKTQLIPRVFAPVSYTHLTLPTN